jgi:hypothetical protein
MAAQNFLQCSTGADPVREVHVNQVAFDRHSQESLGSLSGNMKGRSDLLLGLAGDVIQPSDSSGLVEFIGFFVGGHRIHIDICPSRGQMLVEQLGYVSPGY